MFGALEGTGEEMFVLLYFTDIIPDFNQRDCGKP
jgi:hypothetical protein